MKRSHNITLNVTIDNRRFEGRGNDYAEGATWKIVYTKGWRRLLPAWTHIVTLEEMGCMHALFVRGLI